MQRQTIDATLLGIAALITAAAFIVSAISRAMFLEYFGNEDSFAENLTAIGLIIAGLVLFARIWSNRGAVGKIALGLGVLYALAYIWAGGEEISWGQRILGFDSPDYFQENNDQQEFTFHNLVVGGVKLDELIFGPMLSYIILSYLIVLPLLWARFDGIRRLTAAMVIPVPRLHHAAFALVVTLIIPLLDETRRWEVYECVFALLSIAIFLNPAADIGKETGTATAT